LMQRILVVGVDTAIIIKRIGCQFKLGEKLELAAVVALTDDTELAAHQLHILFADHQPQPGTTVAPVYRRIGLPVWLKNALLLFGGEPDPGVLDRKLNLDPVIAPASYADPYADATFVRELDRVRAKIQQHLLQTFGIGMQNQRHVDIDADIEGKSFLFGLRKQ